MILIFSAITNGALLSSTSLTLQEIHFVRFLTFIIHRYFAPMRSLVIPSPAAYRDVQQELIAEIHRTSVWPVVVTVDGNINTPNKTDFIDRDGSYIILITDGNIKTFISEFAGLAVGRSKLTRLWTSEARFVVAGANEFSMSQQKNIFAAFSIFRIYPNCTIVSQGHYEKDREYSTLINVNDVDTDMKLWVYKILYHQFWCSDV